MDREKPLTAAIIQARPICFDLARSVQKLEDLLADASRRGAQVVTAGETFLPGYPAWLDLTKGAAYWDHPPVKDAFAELRANSVVVPGPEVERLSALCRDLGLVLVLGSHERVESGPGNHTLYNTILTFTPEHGLANHHRKLVPTYTERLVWGPGDGKGLRAVSSACGRVGSLICWEHFMPLARQAMHESGEHVHIAVWPTAHEIHQTMSRSYALEGRCFVLAAGQIQTVEDIPPAMELADDRAPGDLVLRGGSSVIAPDGSYVTEPVFDEETIVIAELDLTQIDREAMTLDVTGHYHRSDVFRFEVRADRPGEHRLMPGSDGGQD